MVSLPKLSKYRLIFDDFLKNIITLIISNEFITEYFEVISRFTNEVVASNVMELLLIRPNVEKYDIYYNWTIITEDLDDNKFVDLVVSSNSDYLVTNDKHFKILKTIDFPNIEVVSLDNFLELLKNK